jgi:hypothetical protein
MCAGRKAQVPASGESHEDDRFDQRRFKRGMEITQMKLLSSGVPDVVAFADNP